MITTNEYIDKARVEPKKLGFVTTTQLKTPNPEPVTRGSGPAKVITTHGMPPRGRMMTLLARRAARLKVPDPEPAPAQAEQEERDVEDHSASNPLTNEGMPDIEPMRKKKSAPKKQAKPKKTE